MDSDSRAANGNCAHNNFLNSQSHLHREQRASGRRHDLFRSVYCLNNFTCGVGLSDHRSHARSVLLEFESFEKIYRLSIGACVLQITTDVAEFIAEAIHHIM
jgi:hypothetical protein